MRDIPLLGYADRLSGRPGDTIALKVSSDSDEPFQARLVRVISADPNPVGPGLIEEELDIPFGGSFPSRRQPFYPGSYALIEAEGLFDSSQSFTLVATVWPTTPGKGMQGIVSLGDPNGQGLSLGLDRSGSGAATRSTPGENGLTVTAREPLQTWRWYRIWATYDATARTLSVGHQALDHPFGNAQATLNLDKRLNVRSVDQVLISAIPGEPIHGHFNGKIQSPMIFNRELSHNEIAGLADQIPEGLLAHWDFSVGTCTTRIEDVGPHRKHGRLVNMPARAMTGSS